MEYAEYGTEVRFSHHSSNNEPNSLRRSREDLSDSSDEDADSDPGILGALTSIFVGGVTDLLTDFSPQPTTPATDRYTSTTKTSSTITVTGSRAFASIPTTAPRRSSRSRYPEAAVNVDSRESGWKNFGMEARHGVATAESSDGTLGHRATGKTVAKSTRGGIGDEDSSWMSTPQQRSRPVSTPATARGRASGTGDVAPMNSLVGSPIAGGNAGGLLGAMFSGITSLGQRATDLLTQLDHDFENIFNGALEGDNGAGSELVGPDRDSEQRVRAGDQGRQRDTSSSEGGSGEGDGSTNSTRSVGKNSRSGGTLSSAGAALPISDGVRPAGGRAVRAVAASSIAKSPTAVTSISVRASTGGIGAATANGGRVGSDVRGRNRQLDKSRSSSGGRDGWNTQGDDESWGWGSSDNEPRRAVMGARTTTSHGSARTAALTSQPPMHGRAQPKAAGLQTLMNSSAGTTTTTMVAAATAAPSSPAARNGRTASSSASGSSATSSASNLRSSRSNGGKVFIIKSSTGSASMRRAETATASPNGGSGSTAAGAGSTSANGAHNAPSLSKAAARADDPIPGAAAEASWAKAPVPVRSSTSTSTGSQPVTLGSGEALPPSRRSTEADSQPRPPQLRRTQTTRADTAAAGAEATAAAAAAHAPTPAYAPASAFSPVIDGAMFVAEAKAALRTMAESAESTQQELRQQLDEARRRADAAEERCAELQQQLEASAVETARLGALAETMGEQLEFSQRRCGELVTGNAHLATAATAAHQHHQHHPNRTMATADAACSPAAAASPAMTSPRAGWSSAIGMAGGHQHGSGGHSRRLSHEGCGGGGSRGGSDELVEATLVAQLTAALADKARLSRENDALARQLEGLQELLSYTAQQVSYDHDDGYGYGDEDYCIQHSKEAAMCGTLDALHWSYRDAIASGQLPPPCEAIVPAAATAAADGTGFPPSSASLIVEAERASDREEHLGFSDNPLYDLTYGGLFSQVGVAARPLEPPGTQYGSKYCVPGGGDITGNGNAGSITDVSKGLSGRVGMSNLEYDMPASLADLYGTTSSLATTNTASSGATHVSSELCTGNMSSQRLEPSVQAQSQQPVQDNMHMHEVSLQQQGPSLLMPLKGQLQEELSSPPPPPPPPPPVRTSSYPDGWEVLDEDGEVVVPQASVRSVAPEVVLATPLPPPPSATSWGPWPAVTSTTNGKLAARAADASMAAANAAPALIAAGSLSAGGGGTITRFVHAAVTSVPMKERTNLPGPGSACA